MPTPSDIFTQMVTSTNRNWGRTVSDNMSAHNMLLNFLKKKGKIQIESGGYELARQIEYAEGGNYTRYSGLDTQNVNQSDILTTVKYEWQQVALHVVASGREIRQNSGRERMINLAKTKKANAMKSAVNNMSIDIYSDGALPNQINGLANIIQANGQGTVGGINSGTWTFWRNKFREIGGTNTYTAAGFKQEMNPLWNALNRGADKPDLIVFTHDFYATFEAGEQQLQRYMSADMANAGFNSLKYKTADVIFDDNVNFSTTGERGYFLNTDYLYLVAHADANWTPDEEKRPTNQDAVVIPIYWMGNLVCTNRQLQGILLDAS